MSLYAKTSTMTADRSHGSHSVPTVHTRASVCLGLRSVTTSTSVAASLNKKNVVSCLSMVAHYRSAAVCRFDELYYRLHKVACVTQYAINWTTAAAFAPTTET